MGTGPEEQLQPTLSQHSIRPAALEMSAARLTIEVLPRVKAIFDQDPANLKHLAPHLENTFFVRDNVLDSLGEPGVSGQADTTNYSSMIRTSYAQRTAKAIAKDLFESQSSTTMVDALAAAVAPVIAHENQHIFDAKNINSLLGRGCDVRFIQEAETSARISEAHAAGLSRAVLSTVPQNTSDQLRDDINDTSSFDAAGKKEIRAYGRSYESKLSILDTSYAEFKAGVEKLATQRDTKFRDGLWWVSDPGAYKKVRSYFSRRLKELE